MRITPIRISKLELTGEMTDFKKYLERIEILEMSLGMCTDYTKVFWIEQILEMQELQDELNYLKQCYYLNEITENYYLLRFYDLNESLKNVDELKESMLYQIEMLEKMLEESQKN